MTRSLNTGKIVFLGAGSAAFGLSMYKDMFTCGELAGSTIVLVDTNPEALERMVALARRMNAVSGAGVVIEHTTDRRAALPGADFVVNAVAIDRNRLWKLDFDIPKKHGVHHTLGENGGPGGLFFTLRTLPLIFDIARDIHELCPNALFINLSNPESRVVLALNRYSPIRSMGMCHGIFLARWFICQILGMAEREVECWGAGLNHFQWLLHIRESGTGRDLYPLLRQREKDHDPTFTPLTRKLFRSFGLWPTCSDDHMGEYLPYGWEGGEHGFNFEQDARDRGGLMGHMDKVIREEIPVPEDWLQPSWGDRAIHLITGILHNRKRFIESGVVYNRGAIPNLPADLAVEVPVVADAAGAHPVSLGPLPDPCARLLTVQAGVQQMAVEAAVHGSKEMALQALLLDPVITSTDAAVALLDELWEINRPYIRPCI